MHPIQRIGTKNGNENLSNLSTNFFKFHFQITDCVNAIAFLADDSANFITGTVLGVDGGLSIKGVF